MRYPQAVWRPLPENETQRKIKPTQVILHTAVDAPGPTSLFPFFVRGDVGAESHFFVRLDGTVEQYTDTEVMANANRTADVRAVSIETEDEGDPEGVPWSRQQLDALIGLIGWLCDTHRIPRRLCPTHDQSGIGWHSMFGFRDPIAQNGPVDNPWSLFRAKTCPGKTRIGQIGSVLMPALTAPPASQPNPTEEDMHLIFVPQTDAWYLSAPAGVARILTWDKVAFWRDVNKLRVVLCDPQSFDLAVAPRVIGGSL